VTTAREHGVNPPPALHHPGDVVRWQRRPQRPDAVVLVLHGGRVEGLTPPGRLSPARLRMLPFLSAIGRATAGRGFELGLGEVVYRCRGWNGQRADAAVDATSAIERAAAASDGAPVVLVGHSMGGRAALRAAGHPSVAGVVALAPWCPEREPCAQLAGRRLLLLHGSADRVTDPAGTRALGLRARSAGAQVCGYSVAGAGHALLGRRAADWQTATARLVAGLLELAPLPTEAASALELTGADPGGLELELPRRLRGWPAPGRTAPVTGGA
jgi:dienelactone hydrolase